MRCFLFACMVMEVGGRRRVINLRMDTFALFMAVIFSGGEARG